MSAADRNALYEWFLMMHGAWLVMGEERRADLEAWEDRHLDGSGRFGSSDWPGWQAMGLPPKPSVPVRPRLGPPLPPRKPVPFKVKLAVYRRDGYRCFDCGSTDDLSIDHRTPVSRGGTNDIGNLRVRCVPCNARKGTRGEVS